MARQRDYKAEYARRKARAAERGFSSPRVERDYRLNRYADKPRDYRAEYQRRQANARKRGFVNAKAEREFAKSGRADKETYQKAATLAYFGITEAQFNRMRTANRKHQADVGSYSAINTYSLERDRDIHNWSPDRVGYVIYYYRAIVDKKTNYDSLVDSKGRRKKEFGKPVTNASQYYYLVKYTNLMQLDEFEARYGAFQVPA